MTKLEQVKNLPSALEMNKKINDLEQEVKLMKSGLEPVINKIMRDIKELQNHNRE